MRRWLLRNWYQLWAGWHYGRIEHHRRAYHRTRFARARYLKR
jgi:hypothetical protein